MLDMLVKECYVRHITAISLEASLSEIEKNREKGKRLHQKIFLAILSGLIALAVSLFFIWILGVNAKRGIGRRACSGGIYGSSVCGDYC